MNGAPIPPIDGAPAFPVGPFLLLLLLVAVVLTLAWFLGIENEQRRIREHEDKKNVFREAVERERENVRKMLIDQSPGGRKPWQE